MTNRVLDEYLARLSDALRTLPADERDAFVAEARAHLREAIEARMATDPGASPAQVTLEETSAFGDPDEIALARGAVPRVTQAPRAFRWPRWASLVAGLIALTLVGLVIVDLVDKPATYRPYHRDNVLQRHTEVIVETFQVRANTETLAVTILVDREAGCAGIRLTDPSGKIVLDQWDACGDLHRSVEVKPQVSGQAGEWKIAIQYRDFTGNVQILTQGTLT